MLICDLDGTLIDQELGRDFRMWLLKNGRFGYGRIILALLFLPINYVFRLGSRGAKLSAWSSFRKKSEMDELVRSFVSVSAEKFTFNNSVILEVKSYEGEKVLLSGSDKVLISEFFKFHNIGLFDRIIGSETKFFGLLFSVQPFGKNKLIHGNPEIAIGDSWQDRFLLNKSAKAMIVGNDRRLNELAKRSGWGKLS